MRNQQLRKWVISAGIISVLGVFTISPMSGFAAESVVEQTVTENGEYVENQDNLEESLVNAKEFDWEAFEEEGYEVVTSEQLAKSAEKLVLTSHMEIQGDYVAEQGIELNGYSLVVTGNLWAKETVNIGNGTLVVRGSFEQPSGLLDIRSGKVYVTKDMIFGKKGANGAIEQGSVRMEIYGTPGLLSVQGNVYINTTEPFGINGHMGYMYIDGNFTQIDHTAHYFPALTLTGMDDQHVHLNKEHIALRFFALSKPDGYAIMSGYMNSASLASHMVFKVENGPLVLNDFDPNGFSMNCIGDLQVREDLELGNGNLEMLGRYTQTKGKLKIGFGQAIIHGDLDIYDLDEKGQSIQGKGGVKLSGEGKLQVDGSIHMNSTGDFLVQKGELVLNGNLQRTVSERGQVQIAKLRLQGAVPQTLTGLQSRCITNLIGNLPLEDYTFDPADAYVAFQGPSGWIHRNGHNYWYENGSRQGYQPDNSGYRGKEIYDPESDAWYWLDQNQQGAMAVSKDVYQESEAGRYGDRLGDNGKLYGKWVRYDAQGHMMKGWCAGKGENARTISDPALAQGEALYYFDPVYGTMAKGYATIYGVEYEFDQISGVFLRVIGTPPEKGWMTVEGQDYWYEGHYRQGICNDPSYRGKEIYDSVSDAWYWLDNDANGKKAVSKDVYQDSLADSEGHMGKWVRYDAEGHMMKGWCAGKGAEATLISGPDIVPGDVPVYYFDPVYGTMQKGIRQIDGVSYCFDEISGVLMRE